ncbi:hypothetical protein Trydic_g6336 [Trypoxylus dichotomus]
MGCRIPVDSMSHIMGPSTLLLSFLLCQAASAVVEDCSTGFSIVAPELAVPGKTTAVLITLHGPASSQPLNVTLRLIPDQGLESGQIPVETTVEIKGECSLKEAVVKYAV